MKTLNYEIKKNSQYQSNEIYFTEVPSSTVRENLKALKMRWNPKKSCWYGFATEEEIKNAINSKQKKTAQKKKEKKNVYGVKVGDLFVASWGYDQTNIDFFQVIELVGEKSVRVREVYPKVIKEDGLGPMSRDVTFENTKELLPPTNYSVFIKDNEKGDLKRICNNSYYKDDVYINLSSFANAYPYKGEKLYESWYA